MKVKKYQAPTMPEALDKVKNEFGDDAVILSSKAVYTGGFLGLFRKKQIEVVAAIEPESPQSKQKKQRSSNETLLKSKQKPVDSSQDQAVLKELRSLRQWMEKSVDQPADSLPVTFDMVKQELIEQDVDPGVIDNLIDLILEENHQTDYTFEEARQLVKQKIEQLFVEFKCGHIDFQKKFIHLVGPTGVGKTTTIAKLAANSMIKEGKKVAFITTDTYRIAAIEQLKTYSNILDIPLEIAYTMEDYQKARLKFQDYDLVFVDTAGRNFKNEKYIAELGKVVDLEHDIETYLVLSLTTKPKDLSMLFNQFKSIPLKQIFFTKSDETNSYGAILNLVSLNKIGVGFLTNGQNVPDDIKKATPHFLTDLLMKLTDDHV